RRPARSHIGIDECGEAMALAGLAPAQGVLEYRILAIEDSFGEIHRIVVTDRELLVVHRASRQVGDFRCVVVHAASRRRGSRRAHLTSRRSSNSGMAGSSSTRGTCPRNTELPR